MNEKRWIGFVLVILGAGFWGIGGTISQRLFQVDGIIVEWLVTVRLLIAGILMLLLSFLFKDRRKIIHIWKDKKTAGQLIIFGIVGMLACQYTYMASISHGNAAVATLLQYLGPIFIILYLVITKVNKLNIRDGIGVVLALTGTFLLLTNGSLGTLTVPASAIVWGLLSGIALAFYTLYPRNLLKLWGSLNVIGWAMIIGGVGMSFIHPPWRFDTSSLVAETYVFLGFVIIFGTMLAFWFFLESLKYLKPEETSLLGNVEPLTAVISSVLYLNITFGAYQIVGTLLILLMVVFLSLFKDKSIEIKSAT